MRILSQCKHVNFNTGASLLTPGATFQYKYTKVTRPPIRHLTMTTTDTIVKSTPRGQHVNISAPCHHLSTRQHAKINKTPFSYSDKHPPRADNSLAYIALHPHHGWLQHRTRRTCPGKNIRPTTIFSACVHLPCLVNFSFIRTYMGRFCAENTDGNDNYPPTQVKRKMKSTD